MKKLASALAVLATLWLVPMANASLQISYKIDGGPFTVCNTGSDKGPVQCTTAIGTTTAVLDILGTSNSPGTPNLAQEFASTLQITTGATPGSMEIWITAQNFMQPSAPPPVDFGASLSTTSTTGKGTAQLEGCVDTTNSLPLPFCAAGPMQTTANETYNGVSSTQDTVHTILSSLTTPYALSQHITLALGANSNVNLVTSLALTPVPEPMSISLLGGIAIFAARAIRRKKQATRS